MMAAPRNNSSARHQNKYGIGISEISRHRNGMAPQKKIASAIKYHQWRNRRGSINNGIFHQPLAAGENNGMAMSNIMLA